MTSTLTAHDAPVIPALGVTGDGAAQVLAAALTTSPRPLTAVIRHLADVALRIETLDARDTELTGEQAARLAARPGEHRAWRRTGLLRCPDGTVAAETVLVLLTGRIPPAARGALASQPAGAVLGPYGMVRGDRRALARHSRHDTAGGLVAVSSSAVLLLPATPRGGGPLTPVGLAAEEITAAFTARLASQPWAARHRS